MGAIEVGFGRLRANLGLSQRALGLSISILGILNGLVGDFAQGNQLFCILKSDSVDFNLRLIAGNSRLSCREVSSGIFRRRLAETSIPRQLALLLKLIG